MATDCLPWLHMWCSEHLGNELLHLLHTIQRVRLESKIYFYSTFSLRAGRSDLNLNIILKYLFPPGTAECRQALSEKKCWTSPENPTQSRWVIFFHAGPAEAAWNIVPLRISRCWLIKRLLLITICWAFILYPLLWHFEVAKVKDNLDIKTS